MILNKMLAVFNKKNSLGFTLVELMIVIGIIGMVSAITFSEVSKSRAVARDAKVKAELKSLQVALKGYHMDNGQYPVPGCGETEWSTTASCVEYIVGLAPTYINELPKPPTFLADIGHRFGYRAEATDNFQSYKLYYQHSETETILANSIWAHCPASCAGGAWNWCRDQIDDYPTFYTVTEGQYSICNY